MKSVDMVVVSCIAVKQIFLSGISKLASANPPRRNEQGNSKVVRLLQVEIELAFFRAAKYIALLDMIPYGDHIIA
ncbi:hypothetical protein D3C77_543140 [compost metagenome]